MRSALLYPAVNAKIKAIRSQMLSEEDFNNLLNLNSVQEAFDYLYNQTYYKNFLEELSGKEIHRRQLELKLKKSIVQTEDFFNKYLQSTLKKLINHYFSKFEIEDLKLILRTILIENEEKYLSDNVAYINRNKKINFDELIQAVSYQELQSILKNTSYTAVLKEHEAQYKKNKNLFPIEMSLDYNYFAKLEKIAESLSAADKRYFDEVIGTQIDLLNIQWIYRIKRYYNLSSGEILNYIIPFYYKINKSEIRNMSQVESGKELLKYISYEPYKNLLEKAVQEEKIIFEKFFLNKIYNILNKIETTSFFSIAGILTFIYSKEYEVRDIVTTIEGIRYSLPKDEIRKFLIRNGV